MILTRVIGGLLGIFPMIYFSEYILLGEEVYLLVVILQVLWFKLQMRSVSDGPGCFYPDGWHKQWPSRREIGTLRNHRSPCNSEICPRNYEEMELWKLWCFIIYIYKWSIYLPNSNVISLIWFNSLNTLKFISPAL